MGDKDKTHHFKINLKDFSKKNYAKASRHALRWWCSCIDVPQSHNMAHKGHFRTSSDGVLSNANWKSMQYYTLRISGLSL